LYDGCAPSFQSREVGVAHWGGGVGQEEHPLSPMRRSHVARSYTRPLRIEPERGQGPEHRSERGSSIDGEQARHVLEEHVTGFALAEDPGEVGPEPSVVDLSAALARRARWLARKAAAYKVDASEERRVEASHVIAVDQSRLQIAALHPRCQDRGGVGISLDVADSSGSGLCDPDAEVEPANSGEEREDMEVTHRTTSRQSP
jgi:hypothetical protein